MRVYFNISVVAKLGFLEMARIIAEEYLPSFGGSWSGAGVPTGRYRETIP